MELYKQMYLLLFRAVTDALEHLRDGDREGACRLLIQAQCQTEEMYLEGEA